MNLIQTSKNAADRKAWEKSVKNFFTQNGVMLPDEDIMQEILDNDDVVVTIEECIEISYMVCGEPSYTVYDRDWVLLGYSDEGTNHEFVSCVTEETVTVNEAETKTVEEEETTMTTITIANASVKELLEMARVTKITKLQDKEYVSRDAMVELAKANGMTVNRKTTRKAALEFIAKAGNERYAELKTAEKKEEPKQESVPVQQPSPVSANVTAQQKTVVFMRKVLNYAMDNQKKGHGYTISAEYLKYFIFEVQFGVKKFKDYASKNAGTPEFAEQMDRAQKVAKWVIDKGYITAITYKVSFDFGGKHFERCCYKPEFNGSDEVKSKMFPIDKCVFAGAENIKWTATTYAVCESAQAYR